MYEAITDLIEDLATHEFSSTPCCADQLIPWPAACGALLRRSAKAATPTYVRSCVIHMCP